LICHIFKKHSEIHHVLYYSDDVHLICHSFLALLIDFGVGGAVLDEAFEARKLVGEQEENAAGEMELDDALTIHILAEEVAQENRDLQLFIELITFQIHFWRFK
jgi:hypothetical protein